MTMILVLTFQIIITEIHTTYVCDLFYFSHRIARLIENYYK